MVGGRPSPEGEGAGGNPWFLAQALLQRPRMPLPQALTLLYALSSVTEPPQPSAYPEFPMATHVSAGAVQFNTILGKYGLSTNQLGIDAGKTVGRERTLIGGMLPNDQPNSEVAGGAVASTLRKYYDYGVSITQEELRKQMAVELLVATLTRTRSAAKIKPFMADGAWMQWLWARTVPTGQPIPPAPVPACCPPAAGSSSTSPVPARQPATAAAPVGDPAALAMAAEAEQSEPTEEEED